MAGEQVHAGALLKRQVIVWTTLPPWQVKKYTLEPFWNETFRFFLTQEDRDTGKLALHVFDWEMIKPDRRIGDLELDLKELVDELEVIQSGSEAHGRLDLTDTSPLTPESLCPSCTVQHTLKIPLVFFTFSPVLRLTGV
eukprot:1194365-Prorocentrum_minimum.AAC.2